MNDKGKMPLSLVIVPPVVSGFMLGLTGAMIAHGAGFDPWIAGGLGILAGFIFGAMIWSAILVDAYRPPKKWEASVPALKPARVQLELRREEGNYLAVDWLDLPENIDFDKMKKVSKIMVANNFDFSHASLAGANKPLVRTSEYEPLRDRLLGIGLLKWKNPNAHNLGLVVTDIGRVFFRTLSTHQPDIMPSMMKWMRDNMFTDTHTETL